MQEIFKEIPGHSNYLCSNQGTVMHKKNKKPLKGYPNNMGYIRVQLGDRKCKAFIHQLVASIFLSEDYREGLVVNHKDGNKTNNKATNLEWCSISENAKHAYDKLNRFPVCGSKHGRSKLTEQEVLLIREEIKKGVPTKVLSEKYGVSARNIRDIKNYVLWKHI